MSETIRLVLIDHHTLLRRCLTATLNRRRGFEVVGDAETGSKGLSVARALRPDVVVVEPDVPDGGPPFIELLCEALPDAAVLVLTDCHDIAAKNVVLAGARGCVEKSCEPEELVKAIKQVHTGETVMSPQVMNTILESFNGSAPSSLSSNGLTERELEVLQLVVAGNTNPEIARRLYITEHTVKGHLAKILGKLGLDNRVQLATYALQNGLVSDAEAELAPQN